MQIEAERGSREREAEGGRVRVAGVEESGVDSYNRTERGGRVKEAEAGIEGGSGDEDAEGSGVRVAGVEKTGVDSYGRPGCISRRRYYVLGGDKLAEGQKNSLRVRRVNGQESGKNYSVGGQVSNRDSGQEVMEIVNV